MNKAYRSIYNESTGTFVAVSENAKARGKRASSRVVSTGKLAMAIAAGALFTAGAVADVEIPDPGNEINFTASGGSINFNGTGTINASSGLTLNGRLTATGITVVENASLSSGNMQVVTGGQLFDTNARVTDAEVQITAAQSDISNAQSDITAAQADISAAQTSIAALEGQIGDLGTSITTDSLDVAGGALVASSSGVTMGTDLDMDGNKITGLADGNINASSTDAVTGRQVHNLFIEEGATGVRYFRANSEEPDSEAKGQESIAVGPNTIAEGDSSFAAGDGAETTEEGVAAIALGQSAVAGGRLPNSGGAGAIAIGRDSAASGTSSIALGDGSVAGAGNATALGAGALASGARSIALGGADAAGDSAIAAGVEASASTRHSIALGTGAGQETGTEINDPGQRHSFIAIGHNAGQGVDGNHAISIGVGAGSNTIKSDQVAIGTTAGTFLEGERNVSLGFEANHYGDRQKIRHATAIGGMTKAMTDAVAVGYGAYAEAESVALGAGARAEGGSIALGNNSFAEPVAGNGYITGVSFAGDSVSVGNTDTGLTRRITNVEDGSAGHDAVNVNQLEALKASLGSFTPVSGGNVNYNLNGTVSVAAATAGGEAVNLAQMNQAIAEEKPRFYSVNPNGDLANENGEGALGPNSDNSMAIGHAAKIDGAQRATAMGYSVLVKANDGTALGSGSTVNNEAGVAIGQGAYSRGLNSIAIGTNAENERQAVGMASKNAIAIGTSSRATHDSASALGHHATASGEQSSAVGYRANASGEDALAFGTTSVAKAQNSQASGTDASATGVNAQASGTGAGASGYNSIATGTGAAGYATDGIAMGTGAVSGFDDPTNANPLRNTAGIAIGNQSLADERHALALGVEAQARAAFATAIGDGAEATAQAASALGQGAEAAHADSVALGSGARTAAAVGTADMVVDKNTYAFAGTAPIATVSVGVAGGERTITNVAAGRISASSTDAINGSQLYGTNMALNALADDLDTAGGSIADVLGGDAAYDPDTHQVTMSDVGGTGEDTVHDAIAHAAQGWDVSANGAAAQNVAPGGRVDFSNDDGNIEISRSGTNLVFNLAENIDLGADGSVTTGDTVMNDSGVQVGGHVSSNDPSTTVGAGVITVEGSGATPNTIVIHGERGDITGLTNTDLNGGDFAQAGRAATEEQLALVNQTANAGWNVSVDGEGALADGSNKVGPAGVVDFSSEDGNIVIDRSGTNLAFGLAKDLTGLDSITINNGGPVINVDGINMGGKRITNLAPGQDGTDAVNVDQLSEVSDVANMGWNVSVGGEGALADGSNKVGPGGIVDFGNSDNNIVIERDGSNLTFDLAENIDLGVDGSLTTGATIVNNDGVAVGDTVALTDTGLAIDDGAGNSTTTTIAGTTVTNAAGDTTTVGADHVTVADAAGSYTTVGSTQVVVGGATGITIDGGLGRIGGLTNTTFDPDNYTSGQAATEDQLKQVSDVASAGWHVTDADGNTANIGPDGVVTFEGDGNIAVAQTGDDQDGVVEITLNKNVDLGADGSLKTGDTVINNTGVSVGGDVHLGNTGLVIAGGPSITTAGINAGNMVITNVAPGVNDTDAVNYGQLRPISEFLDLDASGTFAYNGSQHSTLKDALDSMHWNVEAPAPDDSGSSGGTGGSGGSGGAGGAGGGGGNGGSGGTPIHNSNTVGFVAGDNIVISKSDRVNDAGERVGADIQVAVSQDLNVTSITAVNVQADEIQISNGGPVINENGIDMSGKPITNVAAGVNETDAVNVGQLQQAAGHLQGQVNSLRNDVRRLDNKLSAGVAAAMATAALPQAYLPGKNMMAMAGGTWNGESGMAIGFSGITDNGKWVYKLSGNATSRGDYGGAVGVGYQW